METSQVRAELYVDPGCPFAWLAAPWLTEVGTWRRLDLRLHLMSLWLPLAGRAVTLAPVSALDFA